MGVTASLAAMDKTIHAATTRRYQQEIHRIHRRGKAAMKERVLELKADAAEADGESDLLAKIAVMTEPDRAMAQRLHVLITSSAPVPSPKIWYGTPAYAKDGNVVCWFQPAQKFKTRYATFGFSDKANFDDGTAWPVTYALTKLTSADEARIGALVKKAVS